LEGNNLEATDRAHFRRPRNHDRKQVAVIREDVATRDDLAECKELLRAPHPRCPGQSTPKDMATRRKLSTAGS
jgi:hypothetical protein